MSSSWKYPHSLTVCKHQPALLPKSTETLPTSGFDSNILRKCSLNYGHNCIPVIFYCYSSLDNNDDDNDGDDHD